MADQSQPGSLLEGCRVLDLTNEMGHYCGRVLGDFGADVIKIEPPGGDLSRRIGPFYQDTPDPEKSLFWWFTNANKRGVTLDLTTADGKALFRRLAKSAAIIVESSKPGHLASLGLDYQALSADKPDLVMTSITPFGQTGPYAHYAATDLTVVSMGGMMRLYGDLDRSPVRISAPQAYFLGGVQGAVGTMVAHYHREMTGEGQYVDVSAQQAVTLALMISAEIWDLLKVNLRGTGPFGISPRKPPEPPVMMRLVWPCQDGHVLLFLAGGAQAGMVASSRKVVELANAEGYALAMRDYDWTKLDMSTVTQADLDMIVENLTPYVLSKTKAELFAEAVKHGLLIAPATTTEDIAKNPQLEARSYFVQVNHPEFGRALKYPGAPLILSEAPWQIRHRAPQIGEHNEEILGGELGLSKSELATLKSARTI